jgi:hypothetical protein
MPLITKLNLLDPRPRLWDEERFDELLGTEFLMSPTAIKALGGAYNDYMTWFEQYFWERRQDYPNPWFVDLNALLHHISFYDRALICYQMFRMTGHHQWLSLGNMYAKSWMYRVIVEPGTWLAQSPYNNPVGTALYYLATGDDMALTVLARVGDQFSGANYGNHVTDGRSSNKTLLYQTINAWLGIITPVGYTWGVSRDWPALAAASVTTLWQKQQDEPTVQATHPYGPWRWTAGESINGDGLRPAAGKAFQNGMVMDALNHYYWRLIDQDSRILQMVQDCCDFWMDPSMTTTYTQPLTFGTDDNWETIRYLEEATVGEGSGIGTPILHNFLTPHYAWLYYQTGDTAYKTFGEFVFSEGVDYSRNEMNTASFGKQFNEFYHASLRVPYLFNNTIAAPAASGHISIGPKFVGM